MFAKIFAILLEFFDILTVQASGFFQLGEREECEGSSGTDWTYVLHFFDFVFQCLFCSVHSHLGIGELGLRANFLLDDVLVHFSHLLHLQFQFCFSLFLFVQLDFIHRASVGEFIVLHLQVHQTRLRVVPVELDVVDLEFQRVDRSEEMDELGGFVRDLLVQLTELMTKVEGFDDFRVQFATLPVKFVLQRDDLRAQEMTFVQLVERIPERGDEERDLLFWRSLVLVHRSVYSR